MSVFVSVYLTFCNLTTLDMLWGSGEFTFQYFMGGNFVMRGI